MMLITVFKTTHPKFGLYTVRNCKALTMHIQTCMVAQIMITIITTTLCCRQLILEEAPNNQDNIEQHVVSECVVTTHLTRKLLMLL